jgi:hypothetical protein
VLEDACGAISPALVVCHDRPSSAQKVLNALTKYPPRDLYLFLDSGAQNENETMSLFTSTKKERELRGLNTEIWKTEKNLGPKLGPLTAINWIMAKEGEGIILEEDVVPHPNMPLIYSWALHQWRDEPQIGAISGGLPYTSFLRPGFTESRLLNVWGWATWKNRISDASLEPLSPKTVKESYSKLSSFAGRLHYKRELGLLLNNPEYCWSYYIQNHFLKEGIHCLIPSTKLCQNIGIGPAARRTTTGSDPAVDNKAADILTKPATTGHRFRKWGFQEETESALEEIKFGGITSALRAELKIGQNIKKIAKLIRKPAGVGAATH